VQAVSVSGAVLTVATPCVCRYFAVKRTHNAKGVTIPSQRRYVLYFDRILSVRRAFAPAPAPLWPPPKNPCALSSISLHPIPKALRSNSNDLWFTVSLGDPSTVFYSSQSHITPEKHLAENYILLHSPPPSGAASTHHGMCVVNDDVLITVYHSTLMGHSKLFWFWFNTRMLVPAPVPGEPAAAASTAVQPQKYQFVLRKHELDGAVKDKKHVTVPDNFYIEVTLLRKP
jgi:phosphatidylinositol-3,4,5-trisphosphate 3-phosphatase/dual-specificity protein phosphatase PTEN